MAMPRSGRVSELEVRTYPGPREKNEDEEEEILFERAILKNERKFAGVFDRIYQKYGRDFGSDESGGEEVDLEKLELLEFTDKPAGSNLDIDLLSDDESEPDPELTAILHQKIVTVKKEINWDEEEHRYLNRKRPLPHGSSESDSNSPCSSPPSQRARTAADKPTTKFMSNTSSFHSTYCVRLENKRHAYATETERIGTEDTLSDEEEEERPDDDEASPRNPSPCRRSPTPRQTQLLNRDVQDCNAIPDSLSGCLCTSSTLLPNSPAQLGPGLGSERARVLCSVPPQSLCCGCTDCCFQCRLQYAACSCTYNYCTH